jgi:hypothetical protein
MDTLLTNVQQTVDDVNATVTTVKVYAVVTLALLVYVAFKVRR